MALFNYISGSLSCPQGSTAPLPNFSREDFLSFVSLSLRLQFVLWEGATEDTTKSGIDPVSFEAKVNKVRVSLKTSFYIVAARSSLEKLPSFGRLLCQVKRE